MREAAVLDPQTTPVPVQTPAATLVRVTELEYEVAGRTLLRQVSLSLQAGELLVVLGRNGAGKSTLLKHLTGELGRRGVELFGQALPEWRGAELARRRAVLPQQTPVSFAYEVLDVVLLGRIPHGRNETPADRAIAAACLARVGLAGYEGRNIQTLSGGEQQRVHLARTLAQLEGTPGDRVLLLDEPTASLDLAHQHATLRLARDLCAQGVGVLAVLHDLNLAAQYADRVLLLSDGAVLTCDTPSAALTRDHIHAAYGHEVLVTRHPCLDCPLIVSAQ
ncbi:heme ABC transporter ATP-binding protein [Deinococcus sp. HMF7604]|uniref:heme ABC transporter ATP-binding protein n=1 Tax=Deinococcus betulae TaxID=2873312 RepID=UPI001CCAC9AA|nr:heme ABC transporter ATP-binding protein [Deinococcus betulae]MBZ9753049.1 heme ABC transporter ATP-binding protein [Deinococcus betulae]